MKHLFRNFTAMVLSLMLLFAFMPGITFAGEENPSAAPAAGDKMTAPAAGDKMAAPAANEEEAGDEDAALVALDRSAREYVEYWEIDPSYPKYSNFNERILVTYNGSTTMFTFKYNDFYDKDWKSLSEYGLDIYYSWKEQYDFSNMWDHIGESYTYFFYLYRVNEEGKPIDENGDPVENPWDADIVAFSDYLTLTATADHIERTINGAMYLVYTGNRNADIVESDPEVVKGALNIPAKVSIQGTVYPVTDISAGAFNFCEGLTSVKLPNTIKNVEEGAFANTGMKQISIPSSVESIGDQAFGWIVRMDPSTHKLIIKPVKGFVVYAKTDSAGEYYAYDNGLKLITEKDAKKMKPSLKAKALKNRKARLTWSKKKYANGYQIFQKTGKKGKYKKVATIKSPGKTKWTSKKFGKKLVGKKVYYKVRTYTDVGNTIYYGKWSKVRSVKIKK